MATGDHAGDRPPEQPAPGEDRREPRAGRELQPGEAVVGTGRISAARRVTSTRPALPFRQSQLTRIDHALVAVTRSTGLSISVYLGDLGADPRARADELLDAAGAQADNAVLVAVSPDQRLVEVVTGARARRRLTDRGCRLMVMSMVASFEQGDLGGGLVDGLWTLADQTDQTDQTDRPGCP